MAVFLSMASVNLPTAMERRSPLFAGSTQPGRPARTHTQCHGVEMKTLLLASTTLALLAAINLSPAMARGSKLSGGNTWPGISQRVEPGVSTIAAVTPRYEFQYGYDKHARWRGHWVLVR